MESRTFSPPIQSIWIEEDQFMEKFYGFQVDQLLEPDDDAIKLFKNVMIEEEEGDEEEEDKRARILIVNSAVPRLGNKSNISLEKTVNFLDTESQLSNQSSSNMNKNVSLPQRLLKVLTKSQIINRMKSKVIDRHNINSSKVDSISGPFQFQHISHGEDQMKRTPESNEDASIDIQKQEESAETIVEDYADTTGTTLFSATTSKTSVAFSAFCTPKLNRESVNSSEIFNLERKYDTLSLSSPTTLVTSSTFR